MRVVQINSFGNLSTGSVMRENDARYVAQGHETWMFWGRGPATENSRAVNFNTKSDTYLDVALTRLDGKAGFHSERATKVLLGRLDIIRPDLVHLHNLHGYYINIVMLFDWLSKHQCKVKWTLHDCWAFTGHCAYFTYVKCDQWKCGHAYACGKTCPQLNTYPRAVSKSSVAWNYEQKRRIFTQLSPDRMELITPSQWLADLVADSFLAKYPVRVVHNTINKGIFRPTPSDFRKRYGLEGKFIVLGVASTWSERKGLDDFVKLAATLDNRFAIVLVGLSKRQIRELPHQIGRLSNTGNTTKAAELHSTADLYLTTIQQESYEMTATQATACRKSVAVMDGMDCSNTSEEDQRSVIQPDLRNLNGTVVCAGGCVVVMFERTSNAQQLAAIYSAADLLFNPTKEENYPTVNLEAEGCGTPVITYDTGGCRETIARRDSGVIQDVYALIPILGSMIQ